VFWLQICVWVFQDVLINTVEYVIVNISKLNANCDNLSKIKLKLPFLQPVTCYDYSLRHVIECVNHKKSTRRTSCRLKKRENVNSFKTA